MGSSPATTALELPRDLGDGLVQRRARLADAAELAEFNGVQHGDDELDAQTLVDWTLDLFETPHPTFGPERDVSVVVDTTAPDGERIVSALFLIPQTWRYGEVALPVGQPELIATDPGYRRRGLIKAQFDVVHEWSRAAGQRFQFISGIPWYYRQFGYDYALDLPPRPVLWLGGRSSAAHDAADRPGGTCTVRVATAADAPALAALEADGDTGTDLGPLRGPGGFALELTRRPGSMEARRLLVVEHDADDGAPARPLGFVAHTPRLRNGLVTVNAFALARGRSWLAPTDAVLAHLDGWVRAHPGGPGRGIRLSLPRSHPAVRSAATRLGAGPPGSYGLYVRVPDVAAFLTAVTPVLDRRLAASPAVGWTGTLTLDLYTEIVVLDIVDGRVTNVIGGPAAHLTAANSGTDAALPRHALLHLLLGNRRLAALEVSVPDCDVLTDAGALLVDSLFPTMALSAWEYG